MTTKKSTLTLVAERAGVSTASVSRVLNGLPASEQVIERVRRAADELGYVPDATARSLRAGRTEQISIAVADIGNPVYIAMVREVTRVVTQAGYRVVLSNASTPDEQVDLVRGMNRGFADGLILIPLRLTVELADALKANRLPVVVVGSLPPGVDLDNVRADSVTGIGLAVDHLVQQGRERIAFVNGPVDTVPGAARLGGYLKALTAHGLAENPESQVAATDFTYAAGLEAARTLFDQSSPDAVVAANDLLAIATQKVLHERNIAMPDAVAVVGIDDSDLAELAHPSLTSVNLGWSERAVAAAELLLRRIADPDAEVQQLVVQPKLIVRASTDSTDPTHPTRSEARA